MQSSTTPTCKICGGGIARGGVLCLDCETALDTFYDKRDQRDVVERRTGIARRTERRHA